MDLDPTIRRLLFSGSGTVAMLTTSHPRAAQYQTSDKGSFAYVSAQDRWPVIVVRFGLNAFFSFDLIFLIELISFL